MEAPIIKFQFGIFQQTKKWEKTLTLSVFNDGKKGVVLPPSLVKALGLNVKALHKMLEALSFAGKSGQIAVLPNVQGPSVERLILLGLGEAEKLSVESIETAGAKLFTKLHALKQESASLCVVHALPKKSEITEDDIAYHLSIGLTLKSYKFDDHKFKTKEKDAVHLKKVTLIMDAPQKAKARIQEFEKVAKGVFWTRTLVNQPANILYPKSFVEAIKKKFKGTPVKVLVYGEKELKKMGAHLMLSVGQASDFESYMVVLEYDGRTDKKKKTPPVAFVGKGVCFDTGGNSMKPANSMMGMQMDMGGAGVVVGLFHALVERKAKVHVVGAVGLVENMVAGNASRPNDIVGSMSGQTVEILNTDAEGRLVLADVLWHVQEKYKPKRVIDLATLTGAIIVSLGGEYAGMFSNDNAMVEELKQAGESVREPVWHMPLCKAYDKALDSHIADMKNIGSASGGGGSATAAAFLQRFIQKDVAWTHLDIAGVTMEQGAWHIGASKGATGYGVRLLDHWLKQNVE